MQQTLTIVTVVYNEADKIRFTLEKISSLKKETAFEYVVVDGKSTDGTTNVIKEYSGIIDQYLSEEDNGIYDAMNKGIRLANGEYIGLLNAGDAYLTDAFKDVVDLIQNSEYDIIYGGLNILDEDRNLLSTMESISPEEMFYRGPNNFNHPSFFIKKKVYQELGYHSLNYDTAGDFEFSYKAFLKGYKFYNTGKIHTNFLKGGASYRKSPYQKIRIYKKYLGAKPGWGIITIAEKIFVEYPLYFIIRLMPKKMHYRYLKWKYEFLGSSGSKK